MTAWAQNALLKLLEEPPPGVMFLLTCDNRFQLLETVRSRVVLLTLEGPGAERTEQALREQMPGLDPDKARWAAQASGGNIGRAKQMLEEEKDAQWFQLAQQLCRQMEQTDRFGMLQLLAGLEKDREGLVRCLEQVRQVLAGNTKSYFLAQNGPAYRILPLQAEKVLAIIEQGMEYARQNMNMPLLITWLGAGIGSALGE